jgi:hypothetical protein
MAFAQVTTYPGALESLLHSPTSEIAKELAKFGSKVESQAKINASGRPGPRVQTGRLRASIGWHVEIESEIVLYVGFGASYGVFLELGYQHRGGGFVHYPFLKPAVESLGGTIGSFR